jgi:hypothetical protein
MLYFLATLYLLESLGMEQNDGGAVLTMSIGEPKLTYKRFLSLMTQTSSAVAMLISQCVT